MSIEQGFITNVVIDDSGTELVADVVAGATTLFVADAYSFNSEGGSLELNGISYSYSTIDYELNTITVSPVAAALAEDKVYVLPRGSTKVAMVNTDDGDEGVRAIVPFEMTDAIDDGIRDPWDQESIFISDETGRWEVKALDEEIPNRDASYIDPGTFPDPGGPTEPPAISPEIDVTGTAEAFVIEADAVEPSTEIIYEISEDFDPDTLTGTWTPLAGTPTKSTVYVLAAPPSGGAFEEGKVYGFRAIATNGIPPDPAPSTHIGAALDPSRLSELITTKLVAGFILGETIQVGAITINANTGITIPQPNNKVIHFPARNDVSASITAALVATALTIQGNSFVYGLMQVFAKISLVAGITNPTEPPTLNTTYPFKQSDITEPDQVVGMCDTPGGTEWALAGPTSSLKLISKTTGLQTGTVTLSPGFAGPILSVTMLGGKYYTVGLHLSTQRHMITRWSATGTHESTINTGAPSTNFPSHNPALGNDGTNLLLAYVAGGNDWRVATIDPTTGLVTANIATDVSTATELRYVGKGNFDFGASRIVIGRETGGSVRVFNTSGVSQTASNFNRAATTRGMVWDGTRFLCIDDSGKLYQYAQTPAAGTLHASYDWCDPDGTPRTADSPDASIAAPARAWLRIEGSPAPQAGTPGTDKAERVGIYASLSGAVNLKRQAILANGQTLFDLDLLDTGGVAPSSTNGFLAVAAPGIIDSLATVNIDAVDHPLTRFAGDGTFSLLGQNSWESSEIAATGSWLGYIRFHRIGQWVIAEGYVDRNTDFGTSATAVSGFTIPTWARPSANRGGAPHSGYNSANTYRMNYNTDGTVTIQRTGTISTFMRFHDTYHL